jgi:hypothetical protein
VLSPFFGKVKQPWVNPLHVLSLFWKDKNSTGYYHLSQPLSSFAAEFAVDIDPTLLYYLSLSTAMGGRGSKVNDALIDENMPRLLQHLF